MNGTPNQTTDLIEFLLQSYRACPTCNRWCHTLQKGLLFYIPQVYILHKSIKIMFLIREHQQTTTVVQHALTNSNRQLIDNEKTCKKLIGINYFKGRNFRGQKLSRFSQYREIFVFRGHKLSRMTKFQIFRGHKLSRSVSQINFLKI